MTKISYILIELAFSTEIFSKRRKICACMKKAQSWVSDCETDRSTEPRHFTVAKTRKCQMPHYNKGHHIPMCRRNYARVKVLPKAGGASDTTQSSAQQEKIWELSGKSLKNAT